MRGNITRRGAKSWRLKFDIGRDPVTNKRDTRTITVRGTRKAAQAELARLLAALGTGTFVEQSTLTVAAYMRAWVDTAETLSVSPKTAQRYREIIEGQIVPHIGMHPLQKLKAANIADWHAKLLRAGARDGSPLKARTVAHCHRLLNKALADATKRELLTRNPAALLSAPRVTAAAVAILSADEVKAVLAALRDELIYPQVFLLLSTGLRRGELMALKWSDVDFDSGKLRIERSVEKTQKGLRIKAPKTKHGWRTISLPAGAVGVLREHRKKQQEMRLAIGIGKMPDDAFVFGTVEGRVRDPDALTLAFRRKLKQRGLPPVTLHALRHSHASALIAAGTDPVTVSRRLGHASSGFTLSTYAHLFDRTDEVAAKAIDAALDIREV
jgi:integrase